MDKITHLTSVHPRYDTRIFVKQCMSLSKSGYDVSLIVADGKGDELLSEIQIYDVGIESNRFNRFLKSSYRVFKKARSLDSTLFHFHDPELIPVAIILKVMGKKIIYDVHEDLPRQVLRKFWIHYLIRKPLSKIISVVENIASRVFDGVVTVTPTILKRFTHAYSREVRNYPEIESDIRITDTNKDNFFGVYIGGITEDRGIKQMIRATQFAESKELKIAGKFVTQKLESECHGIEGWENIDFLGWSTRDEVNDLLQSASFGLVVLQPTGDYEDAYPVKMFEYMASGIPVISSNFPLWKSIIDKSQCGICVDPTAPEEIANAINYLAKNRDKAETMGANGRQAIELTYNWKKQAEVLVSMYKTILK